MFCLIRGVTFAETCLGLERSTTIEKRAEDFVLRLSSA